MKLIIKSNKSHQLEYDFLYIQILTNNINYSIYPNYENIILSLIKAKIDIINYNNILINLFNDINGLLIFKNNSINIIIF